MPRFGYTQKDKLLIGQIVAHVQFFRTPKQIWQVLLRVFDMLIRGECQAKCLQTRTVKVLTLRPLLQMQESRKEVFATQTRRLRYVQKLACSSNRLVDPGEKVRKMYNCSSGLVLSVIFF